jgi:hypothetical protein
MLIDGMYDERGTDKGLNKAEIEDIKITEGSWKVE